MTSRITQGLSYLAYYLVASKLPRSHAPGGSWARSARSLTTRRLLARVGSDVNVEKGATFGSGRELVLGDRSGLGIDADIHGPVTIGNDVMMGPRCTILTRNHRIDRVDVPMNSQGFEEFRPVTICDDVWIGANVTIMPGVVVGRGAVLAAGAVVTTDVPEFAIVGGVPARVLRTRLEP